MADHARRHRPHMNSKWSQQCKYRLHSYTKMPPAQGPGQPRPSAFPFLFAVIFPLFRLLFSLTPIAQPQDFNLLTPESIAPLGDKPSALIVTAHPDDEVMFFSPTILGLIGAGWNVRGLCLSTGKFHSWTLVKAKALLCRKLGRTRGKKERRVRQEL